MKIIDLIAGARPNFMKIASIIDALEQASQEVGGAGIKYRLVHTGQHYDPKMPGEFFEQLGIPEPAINLGAGGGTQADQTAAIMTRYEKALADSACDLCVVVGDVTSTMACAIVAKKSGVQVAHVEGGIRSGDWTMPEEINRVVIDSICDWFFTTSETANGNLRRAGVPDDRIVFVGNTMIDTLLKHRHRSPAESETSPPSDDGRRFRCRQNRKLLKRLTGTVRPIGPRVTEARSKPPAEPPPPLFSLSGRRCPKDG